jgi:transposase
MSKTRRDFNELERRRRKGMRLLAQGYSQAEVARRCEVSRTSALRWDQARRLRRGAAWKSRTLGRPPKVTSRHLRRLEQALVKGAQAHGYLNDLWTLPRIAEVLERLCNVHTHPAHLWKVLARMGWSCQRPAGRAQERDEEAIARWKRHTWPALKKSPAAKAAPLSLLMRVD